MSYDPEPEIRDYVERLSDAAHDLPPARRQELLGEIEQHIRETLARTRARTATKWWPCSSRSETPWRSRQPPQTRHRSPEGIATPPSRRRRRRIIALVALVVIALAIGAGAWIQSYQPLAFAPEDALAAGSVNTFGENGHGAWVGYSDGIGGANRPFFGVAIQNTERFTVRVLGLGEYAPPLPLLRGWSSRLLMARGTFVEEHHRLPSRSVWKPGRLRPFQPVDLAPGQMVMVVLRGVWHIDCVNAAAGSVTPPRSFPIRYRFLWKTRTAEIPFPGGLRIDPRNPHPKTDCHRRP